MTNLNDKAIDIKGKKYVLVSDRILAFNEMYPNGSIQTVLISDIKDEVVVMKALVTPDIANPTRVFTGYSQAKWGDGYINKTSALENCETSCVGRAIAMMGIGVIDSVASVDEVVKATNAQPVSHEVAHNGFPDDTEIDLGVCEKCGAPKKKYSTGKIGCSKYCWKK